MCKTNNPCYRPGAALEFPLPLHLRQLLFVLFGTLLMFCGAARAEDVDDQYVHVLVLMQQGDVLKTSGDNTAAVAKYRAAQAALAAFRKDHPDWNVKVVNYRSNTIVAKIIEITGEAPPGTITTGAQSSASTSGQTVKLLEAGAEPRTMLRLHPKAGDKQTVLITMKMAMDMKMGETQMPATKLPPMAMTMDVTVNSVSPDGDIDYDTVISDAIVIDDPEAQPLVVEGMKKALASLKGLTGTRSITSRGIVKKAETKVPPGIDPQTRQIMDQMRDTMANLSHPFPEEAIGPGAKWETKTPIKSQGLTISQAGTYELVSVEGDRVTAKSTITQSAANQKMPSPAMPTMKMDLTKMTGKSTGNINFDLAQVMPPDLTLDMHADMLMAMNNGGQKQNMSMTMDMNLRVETK